MSVRELLVILALVTATTGLVPARAQAPASAAPTGLAQMRTFAKGLLAEGLYEESIEAYQAIVTATPDDERSHYDLAGALGFVRRYAEAIDAIDMAITIDPGDVRYHELAAIAHQQLQHYEEALAATLRGAELGDVKAMYTLAGMYEHGRGTEPSAQRALYWLRQAAQSGHLGAMDAMARVHDEGLYGQARDSSEARRWRERLQRELARF